MSCCSTRRKSRSRASSSPMPKRSSSARSAACRPFLPRAAQVTPFKKIDDYRDYVKRIRATPKLVDDTIERLKPGLASGWMSTKPVLDRIVAAIDAHLVENVDAESAVDAFCPDGRQRSRGGTRGARCGRTPRGRRRLPARAAALQGVHRRNVSAEGAGRLPGSPRIPAARGTTNTSSARASFAARRREEIHALGLAEVKRLRAEIGAIAKEVGFNGTTDQFIEHMRSDPKFFFDSAEAVLAAYRAMPPRVDPQLPEALPQRAAHALRGASNDAGGGGEQHRGELPGRLADARHERVLHGQRARLRERGEVADWRRFSCTRPCPAITCRSRAPPKSRVCIRGARRRTSTARLCRGLGALRRGARLRHRFLQGSVPALRQPQAQPLPRGASRRRYRHPRLQLAARQGDRVHGHRAASTRSSRRARWTAISRIPRRHWAI